MATEKCPVCFKEIDLKDWADHQREELLSGLYSFLTGKPEK